MAKEYAFDKKTFGVQVTATGVFALLILLMCIYSMITKPYAGLFAVIGVVAAYTVWNTFVSISNPEKIIIGEDYISFKAYGREDKYNFCDVTQFRIREFPSAGKMFIRVNQSNLLKGRYWVHTRQIEEGKELFRRLLDMEYDMHPDTIKARARRTNTQYAQNLKKMENNTADPKAKKK